jgi:hypothetical protein
MKREARELVAIAVRAYNPELNVLASEMGENDMLVIMAEKYPQSSDEEMTYVVASYRLSTLILEPEVCFDGIVNLERARIVFEELVRTL